MSYQHRPRRVGYTIFCAVFFSVVVGIAVYFPIARLPIVFWLFMVAICWRPSPREELAR